MEERVLRNCKILVASPQHWEPLKELLNERMGVEINRLVYADTIENIKEVQGNIKMIRWLLSLPKEIDRLTQK